MKRLVRAKLISIGVTSFALFLLVGLGFLHDAYAEEAGSVKKDPIQACLDYIRKDLDRPDSAKILSYKWKEIVLPKRGKKDDFFKNKKELHMIYGAIDSDGDEIEGEDFCVMDPKDENSINNIEIETTIRNKQIELAEIQTKFDKTKKYGIGIVGAYIYDMSEYTEGTGFRVKYYNPTNKTIKYISSTLVGYNPVKDPVKDNRKKKTQITVKGVGPIGPENTAEFDFEYTWFTDLVKTFKIISIKVDYTDGTSKVVKPTQGVWIYPEEENSTHIE